MNAGPVVLPAWPDTEVALHAAGAPAAENAEHVRVTMVQGPDSQHRDGNHGTIALHDSIGGIG